MGTPATAHTELGEFLRACRAAVSPAEVGLPTTPGRRVAGLRREEVALLAGVSADYYTRLEQGRHHTPSDSVVEALANALRLDPAARAHLADLARPRPTGRRGTPEVQRVRASVHRMLDSFVDHPAFVLGRRTDVLAANRLAKALIADFDAMPVRERNKTRWMILDPRAREIYPDWEQVAAEVVGTLRLDAGRHPDDPRLGELVGELAVKSEEFRRWWADHRVVERTHGTKRMESVVGPITIAYEAMTLPGDPDQTLFVYTTEPGSTSEQNLRLLASWTASAVGAGRAGEASGFPGQPGKPDVVGGNFAPQHQVSPDM
ncbi:helix-turn-helix transcriptional regulator [Nocardioides fonticola]|uniref:Helix-turn-helix transcriptional regulator n=1 Tax=Nocardioides fonticola TaxID=450363 RepID=A0ABP7Y3J3_9ACTN